MSFPDYKVEIPQGIPLVGGERYGLGHGLVIAVDGTTGMTRGSEYGRYDKSNKGSARRVRVPNVRFKGKQPTKEEMNLYAQALYNQYSKVVNPEKLGNKIKVSYVDGADYDKMVHMMESAESNNRSNGYYLDDDYDIVDHNCGTYGASMIKDAMPTFKWSGFGPHSFGTPGGMHPYGAVEGSYERR